MPPYRPKALASSQPLPTRCVLHLPSAWDPISGLGVAIKLASDREPGVEWQPESLDRDRDGRWALTLAVDPDDTPELEHLTLGHDVKPTSASQLAAYLQKQSRHLLAFDPYGHKATSAKLLPFVEDLRKRIAAYLRLDPWDLQIAVRWKHSIDGLGPYEVSTLTVSAPITMAPDKRRDLWLTLAKDLIPAVPGTNWWVDDLPQQGRVLLRRAEDPLGAIASYPWVAELSVEGVPFGVDVNANLVMIKLIEANLLMGGSPGSGKSGGITALLCGISRLKHVAIVGIDPKRVELSLWRERCSYVATHESDISRVLGALVDEMERRYELIEDLRKKKISPQMLSEELPLLVLIIDELADILSTGVTREEKTADEVRSTRIRRLIAKGRAAAIVVIAATQKPSSAVIDTSLRDLIALRIGFATTNSAQTDTILGAGASSNGGLCHTIPANLKGVCYVINETDRTPTRARAFWVPDDDVEGVAASSAHLRVDLPWLTATEPPYAETDGPPPAPRRTVAAQAKPINPVDDGSPADDGSQIFEEDPWS
jgi:hypothetical protein